MAHQPTKPACREQTRFCSGAPLVVLMATMAISRIPPLQTLRVLEAAARLQSFTRAAEELSLTQGAVSQHIRMLEEELGIKLFTRVPGGARPTTRAQSLALQVRQGLMVLERAFGRRSAALRSRQGRNDRAASLTVSVMPSFCQRWLIPRLPAFRAQHPNINLDLRQSVELARFDGPGAVDVALRYGPGRWRGLTSERLMEEEVFPVASPDYRGGRLPRRMADLAQCTLLRHSSQPWEPWFQAVGLDLAVAGNAPLFDDAGQLLDAAARGAGVALGRRSLAQADLSSGRLVRLWKRSIIDVHAHHIVWRDSSSKLASIEAFRRWLHSAVA